MIADFRPGPRAAANPSAKMIVGMAMTASVIRIRISSRSLPPKAATAAIAAPMTE